MTIQLWFTLVIALGWPIFLLRYLNETLFKQYSKEIDDLASIVHKTNKGAANSLEMIGDLQKLVEDQDRLIAVLWSKTYGYREGVGGFEAEKYTSGSDEPFKTAWGIKPNWHVKVSYVFQEETVLFRNANFPWGHSATIYWSPEGYYE